MAESHSTDLKRCVRCRVRAAKEGAGICTRCAGRFPVTTKELRDAEALPVEQGLGDKVAAVIHALGFQEKPGCGCGRARAALNQVDLTQSPMAIVRDVGKAFAQKWVEDSQTARQPDSQKE